MVKSTLPRIGTNEVRNFYQQPLQTILKCYKDEQLICNRLAFSFGVLFTSTLPGGLVSAQRRYTHTIQSTGYFNIVIYTE